jgi:diguanylate cyclase (GGDEF)-like protein
MSGPETVGEPAVAVSGTAMMELRREVDELRAQTTDLTTLAGAIRRLASAMRPDETRETICEAMGTVAGSSCVALLETQPEGGMAVAASVGAELEGRSVKVDADSLATIALSSGRPASDPDMRSRSRASGWPLVEASAQAGIWQPIRSDSGRHMVVALGWSEPVVPGPRLLSSLELLADEAAVALERADALAHVTNLARTDPLTELSNRRAWQDELSRELARAARNGQRLSIGLVDLDELKAFNDRWGHAAGDRLLHTAAVRWRRRLRLTDLLARIGGDEFAITLPGCALEEAVELGDQLRDALPDGLTCSVGVAEWVAGEPTEALLKRADDALYRAKDEGRNRTVSSPFLS